MSSVYNPIAESFNETDIKTNAKGETVHPSHRPRVCNTDGVRIIRNAKQKMIEWSNDNNLFNIKGEATQFPTKTWAEYSLRI